MERFELYINEGLMETVCDYAELRYADDEQCYMDIDDLTYIDAEDIYVYDTYGYEYCDCCERWVREDDYNYDRSCCYECRGEGVIQSYHSGHEEGRIFFGIDAEGNTTRQFHYNETGEPHKGLEIEVEKIGASWYELNEHADAVRDIIGYERVHFEEDCSLDDGFEIITQPHTEEAFTVELLPRLLEALTYLKDNGFRSHDGGDCGLHIHFGKEYFKDADGNRKTAETNLVRFFNHNYEHLKKVARRERTGYCRKNSHSDYGYHGEAVNTANSQTTEIRLGRGTLNADSFMAWIDLCTTVVNNLVPCATSDYHVLTSGITDATRDYINSRCNFGDAVISA